MMLRGSPVVGTIFDATADTPNATDPARFSAAMRHDTLRAFQDHQPWLTSNQASPLATRKHTEPAASGTYTRRCACVALRVVSMAARVVTLKKTVPTSCTRLALQSIRPGSHVQKRNRSPAPAARAWGALTVCRYCRKAALVKKIEPTKNTIASASVPTRPTKPGKGPTVKHSEPMAKSTPIHQPMAEGAHQVEPRPASKRPACLRCSRDDHATTDPSGARNDSRVTNGPRPPGSARSQSSGSAT